MQDTISIELHKQRINWNDGAGTQQQIKGVNGNFDIAEESMNWKIAQQKFPKQEHKERGGGETEFRRRDDTKQSNIGTWFKSQMEKRKTRKKYSAKNFSQARI